MTAKRQTAPRDATYETLAAEVNDILRKDFPMGVRQIVATAARQGRIAVTRVAMGRDR
jgi:hypothetical protein